MSTKRKIEIFTAGCSVCDETITLVNNIVCPSCEVETLDMHQPNVAAKAKEYGIRSLPTVVVDGRLADCCTDRGVSEAILREAGVGVPQQ